MKADTLKSSSAILTFLKYVILVRIYISKRFEDRLGFRSFVPKIDQPKNIFGLSKIADEKLRVPAFIIT